MRPSTAVWLLITVLVWGSIAQARELPSQVDLRAAYCVAVLKDRHSKLAWDMVGEPFGSRQLLYEWFYAGDPQVNRIRFGSTPEVERYKQMVEPLLI